MTAEKVDAAIVGGGLAGLSLACHKVAAGARGRTLTVIEAWPRYCHDGVFGSWAAADHPFRDCVTHSWRSWRVRAEGRAIVRTGEKETYRCVPSGRLYDAATARIAEHPNAELLLGEQVTAMREDGDGVELTLASGRRLRAGLVFDSRPGDTGSSAAPSATGARDVDLVQGFVGWHVRAALPVFDPGSVTLMDFVADESAVRFVYVLPFSEHEALVESTAFARGGLPADEHAALLRSYIAREFPQADYAILTTERGAIPMSTRPVPARVAPRILRIGTAGGMVKPSTGYSFEVVQRWSRAVASDLAAGRVPRARHPRSRRSLAMDRIFLCYMSRHPERMPATFLRLFERVPADALVRFLSDRGTLGDAARVVAALPKGPMVREAARSWRLWLRS